MTKLSLIIPIYKVENYIIECLESVCCQLVEGVEVILVNDGTPDNSMLIARKYISEKYDHLVNQFVFIDQDNQGQSVARNNGVMNASGDFIAFVDSDDFVGENYIEIILKNIDNEVDVLSFRGQACNNKKVLGKVINKNLTSGQYFNDFCFIEQNFKNCEWMCWSRVIKKDFFQDNKFPVNVYLEDMYFFMDIYIKAKNIKHVDDIIYFYRQHAESSTNSKSLKYYNSFEFMIDFLIKSINSPVEQLSKNLYEISLNKTIHSYIYELSYSNNLADVFMRLKKYRSYLSVRHYSFFIVRFFVNNMRKFFIKFN
ncbi:glycosyltransferase family 2 protein [Acinetobacter johnsonii]|uniref:glycosyltransferase family 2 protein n=1 Tax=Acinetobacter johnsonii TaxID=40214 RepID=UPI00191B1D31|nr:glycosyltransferase [Acinetobacter johnsonii]QQT92488.1 glycosyltransferase [Acinetobacter johnsonii]